MRSLIPLLIASVLLAVALPGPAQAGDPAPHVPRELVDWVPWVLHGHDDLACPVMGNKRVCVWPGRLGLDLNDRGGSFVLEVQVDQDAVVRLPGDASHWPSGVTDNGRPGMFVRQGDTPAIKLAAGKHVIKGRFTWSRLPESLAVPRAIALLNLRLRGRAVAQPRREEGGLLWLQAGRVDTAEEDRLSLEVHRRIDDGVPVVIETRLRLRVSGSSREEDLGAPLLAGVEPIALSSSLPARLDGQGHLRVQVRPGEWEISVRTRSVGPVPALTAPDLPDPWPEEEIWVFAAAPAVRSAQVTGPPSIDPQRTSLRDDWKSLPAWRLARGATLTFEELRRGQAAPPPDAVTVSRELWLDEATGGFIVRDRLKGALHRSGRVELLEPGVLGHVTQLGEAHVINRAGDAGSPGLEVRDRRLQIQGESAYPSRSGELPAVGWNRDASSLAATLHLPPGWRIVAATGVDRASGTWFDQWSLLDLFFLLLITLAAWRLLSPGWSVLALLVLALAWHEGGAPKLWWLLLLGTLAVGRVVPDGRLATVLRFVHWGLAIGLAIHVLIFCGFQIRIGLFPQLDHGGAEPTAQHYDGDGSFGGGFNEVYPAAQEAQGWAEDELDVSNIQQKAKSPEKKSPGRGGIGLSSSTGSYSRIQTKRSAQVDPQAIVQTGPGLPRWSWNQYPLTWNGPVAQEHTMRLWLLSPMASLLLVLLQVLGLVVLGLRFCDPRRLPRAGGGGAADGDGDKANPLTSTGPVLSAAKRPLALLLLAPTAALLAAAATTIGAPATAHAESLAPQARVNPGPDVPAHGTLQELQNRLTAPPSCAPNCVETPRMALTADARGLTFEVIVHAAAESVWRLPGPDSAWSPDRVIVDGSTVLALRRMDDGFLAVRLREGTHRIKLSGPARDEIDLQFPQAPRILEFDGRGWDIEGWRPDAPPSRSVRLARAQRLTRSDDDEESLELAPWLELRRELDIGVPWLLHNELVREGSAAGIVHARVPVLPGESVTTPGISVVAGQALVTLEAGESTRRWDSTLAESDAIELVAPTDRPWMERWILDCSPIWNCEATGLAPTQHMDGNRALPAWQPWPGESVSLKLTKPVPEAGATTTIDEVRLELTPGRRVLEASLDVKIRSSQGGEQSVSVPVDAELRWFRVDGKDQPVQQEAGRIGYTLEPGEHQVTLAWQQDHAPGVFERSPAVDLGAEAANLFVTLQMPQNKWLLWAGGTRWGAVVTMWQYIIILLLTAFLLGRYAPTPLRAFDWFLLGVGMTQVPVIAPIVVVLWLVALGVKGKYPPKQWWAHGVAQLAVLGLTFFAFIALYAAVHRGLLVQPDMQVEGAGSWRSTLNWYEARSAGALPQPYVLWLPLWIWRVLMLLWALWAALRVFRWVGWGWEQLKVGGWWRGPEGGGGGGKKAPGRKAATKPTATTARPASSSRPIPPVEPASEPSGAEPAEADASGAAFPVHDSWAPAPELGPSSAGDDESDAQDDPPPPPPSAVTAPTEVTETSPELSGWRPLSAGPASSPEVAPVATPERGDEDDDDEDDDESGGAAVVDHDGDGNELGTDSMSGDPKKGAWYGGRVDRRQFERFVADATGEVPAYRPDAPIAVTDAKGEETVVELPDDDFDDEDELDELFGEEEAEGDGETVDATQEQRQAPAPADLVSVADLADGASSSAILAPPAEDDDVDDDDDDNDDVTRIRSFEDLQLSSMSQPLAAVDPSTLSSPNLPAVSASLDGLPPLTGEHEVATRAMGRVKDSDLPNDEDSRPRWESASVSRPNLESVDKDAGSPSGDEASTPPPGTPRSPVAPAPTNPVMHAWTPVSHMPKRGGDMTRPPGESGPSQAVTSGESEAAGDSTSDEAASDGAAPEDNDRRD